MSARLSSAATTWPTGTDYSQAVQNPQSGFTDPSLKRAVVATNTFGMPLAATGQNAVVFLLRDHDVEQAVRCFTTEPKDGSRRYTALASHLAGQPPTAITAARWLDDGIRVDAKSWPVVVMAWVDGQPFNRVVEDLVEDRCGLIDIADAWVAMVDELQSADVMHGDLQHGNVLVDATGSFRLVDLDGAWVPTMEVGPPAEFGHPNYQHPQRGPAQWGRHGDSFSALVVETGLRALAADPALRRFLTGENVLFGREDLANSGRPIWSAIGASSDPEVVRLAEVLGGRASENPATSMVPYGALRQGAVAAARVVVKRAPAALPDLPQPSTIPLAPLHRGEPALRPSASWYLKRAGAKFRLRKHRRSLIEAAAVLVVVVTVAGSAGAAINRAQSGEAQARDRATLLEKRVVALQAAKTAASTVSDSGNGTGAAASFDLGAARAQVETLAAPFAIAVNTMRPHSSAFEVAGSLVTCTGFVGACQATLSLPGHFVDDGGSLVFEWTDVVRIPLSTLDGFTYAGRALVADTIAQKCGNATLPTTLSVQFTPTNFTVGASDHSVVMTSMSATWTVSTDATSGCNATTRTYGGTFDIPK